MCLYSQIMETLKHINTFDLTVAVTIKATAWWTIIRWARKTFATLGVWIDQPICYISRYMWVLPAWIRIWFSCDILILDRQTDIQTGGYAGRLIKKSVVCVWCSSGGSGPGLYIDKLSTSHCNLQTLPQRAGLSYNISLYPLVLLSHSFSFSLFIFYCFQLTFSSLILCSPHHTIVIFFKLSL